MAVCHGGQIMREALMALVLSICFFGVVLAILYPDDRNDSTRGITGISIIPVMISVIWAIVEIGVLGDWWVG